MMRTSPYPRDLELLADKIHILTHIHISFLHYICMHLYAITLVNGLLADKVDILTHHSHIISTLHLYEITLVNGL